MTTLEDSPHVSLACAGTALMVGRRLAVILDSIVVSIPACHAGDRGSIPVGEDSFYSIEYNREKICHGFCKFSDHVIDN